MKTIRNLLVIPFIFLFILSVYCLGDWQKDLTTLGFYAVVKGKATPLKSLNLIVGKNTYSFMKNYEAFFGIPAEEYPFEDLATLSTNDFLVLYGDLPGSKIEVLSYNGQTALIELGVTVWQPTYEKWSYDMFFTLEPQPSINDQKVIILRPQEKEVDGLFFLIIRKSGGWSCVGFFINEREVEKKESSFPIEADLISEKKPKASSKYQFLSADEKNKKLLEILGNAEAAIGIAQTAAFRNDITKKNNYVNTGLKYLQNSIELTSNDLKENIITIIAKFEELQKTSKNYAKLIAIKYDLRKIIKTLKQKK